MKPKTLVMKKTSRRDLERSLATAIAHNKQLADYAGMMEKAIKATHLRCSQQHEKMRLAILPESIKIRAMLAELCVMLGPFCYEKAQEPGEEHAGNNKEGREEIQGSRDGNGENR